MARRHDKQWWLKQRETYFPTEKVEEYHSSPRKTRSYLEQSEHTQFENAKKMSSVILRHENRHTVFSAVCISRHGIVFAGAKNG